MASAMRKRGRGSSAVPVKAWQAVASRVRLGVMVVVAAIAAALTVAVGQWKYAPMIGWDAAATVFSAWTWLSVVHMNADQTARHSTREDPGQAQSDLIVTIACVASLTAVGFVLIQASSASGGTQDVLAGLGVFSVAVSWFALHTLFTLRYARLYYSGRPGGIDFNQSDFAPRYVDFAYLAFTIGMTFQVSDTDLQKSDIRATALRHALLSYLFGAVILGATINLIAGLAK